MREHQLLQMTSNVADPVTLHSRCTDQDSVRYRGTWLKPAYPERIYQFEGELRRWEENERIRSLRDQDYGLTVNSTLSPSSSQCSLPSLLIACSSHSLCRQAFTTPLIPRQPKTTASQASHVTGKRSVCHFPRRTLIYAAEILCHFIAQHITGN